MNEMQIGVAGKDANNQLRRGDDYMDRSRALLLLMMVALLTFVGLSDASAMECANKPDCAACCATDETNCVNGCDGNVNCEDTCYTDYLACLNRC